MSLAIEALLLIRLDARVGEWVEVQELAAHYSLVDHVVAESLDALGKRGQIRVQRDRADGPVVRAIAFAEEGTPA